MSHELWDVRRRKVRGVLFHWEAIAGELARTWCPRCRMVFVTTAATARRPCISCRGPVTLLERAAS